MAKKCFFTLKKRWSDKANGVTFDEGEEYQGERTSKGIVVTGASAYTHTIPYDAINEDYLNPEFGKKK